MKQRPARLPDLQMAAAVGQSRLMTRYEKLFSAERFVVEQVLLTHDDLKNRSRHLNARNAMLTMLRGGIIPIVNEDDVVAVDEIKFGANDLLASLVVHLIDADLLVMLTTSDGLRETLENGRSRRVSFVESVTEDIMRLADGRVGSLSTGGMTSKLCAAREVMETGVAVVIADGRKSGVLRRIIAGDDIGTFLQPVSGRALQGRKRWLAFFQRPSGTLVVDEGARRAILERGTSLLPVGIRDVEGSFNEGAAVDIVAQDRSLIARGLVSYSSDDIRLIMGRKTNEIAGILGGEVYEEVVHRDNMVLLKKR